MADTVQDDKPWTVMKYGGTSVGKFLGKITSEIVPSYLESNRVVVVCSARSGKTKTTGTTSLILRAADEALNSRHKGTDSPKSNGLAKMASSGVSTPISGFVSRMSSNLSYFSDDSLPFNATVDQIKSDHLEAAKQLLPNSPELLETLEQDITNDCEHLRNLLLATQIIDEISAKSKDMIMGIGERLACRLVTAGLQDCGVEAEFVSLENVVSRELTEKYSEAANLPQAFYDELTAIIGTILRDCGSKVPVVTGFFGILPGSLLSQVGRGYSDLCAALCSVALKSTELQIWKEVDGIFTADPRKVATARLLPSITPEEAAELTFYGSEVIHPFTMEQVIRANIPIRIKNVERPAGAGTVVFPEDTGDEQAQRENQRLRPTAITTKDNIIVLSLRSNRKTISHGFFATTFGILNRYSVSVDLIATSEVQVSMAISGSITRAVLEKVVAEMGQVGEVSIYKNLCILSLVGRHMKNMVGISGRMFSTLAEGKINIEMISQGASEINISCVIKEKDAEKALNLAHIKLLSKSSQNDEWF